MRPHAATGTNVVKGLELVVRRVCRIGLYWAGT